MASMLNLSGKVEVLEKVIATLKQKGESYYNFTVSINDETGQFGHNVSATISQTKEERDSKKPKFFIGNGKVFWTDGNIRLAENKESKVKAQSYVTTEDDLPF